MTVWLERSESRFLDLISISVKGLVKASLQGIKPDKYNLFKIGSHTKFLSSNINPILLESTINNSISISGGRYIREFAYVLLALDLAVDNYASDISQIKFDRFEDIKNISLIRFIQSNKSRYSPTASAFKLSKLSFASEEWRKELSQKILGYGYFCRWLDTIDALQHLSLKYLKEDKIKLIWLKNLIGPFDRRVRGSGPDFIQTTFKSWAFLLGLVNIITNGKLSKYTIKDRLNYLRKHTGYITDGNDAYTILRNIKMAHITINQVPPREVRVVGFMRLVNLDLWRKSFNLAMSSALRRMRIMFILNNNSEKRLKMNNLVGDSKIKEIMDYFDFKISKQTIFEDLLFLESTGILIKTEDKAIYNSLTAYFLELMIKKYKEDVFLDLEKIESRNIFYEKFKKVISSVDINNLEIIPMRRLNIKNFEMYAPGGELIEWIKKN